MASTPPRRSYKEPSTVPTSSARAAKARRRPTSHPLTRIAHVKPCNPAAPAPFCHGRAAGSTCSARSSVNHQPESDKIDELFASEQDLGQVLEEVARLSVRLVIQAAVEAEVTEFLGRDRYQRGDRDRVGYRNGRTELTVKTTAGPVVLERPKLRGTTQPFTSRLLGKGVSRTNALEALVLSGFVRGLSVRDVEAALAEALGPEAALSKSTVSRICEAIKTEFDA
jgi:hypothetical protein